MSRLPWFRLDTGIAHDPKLLELHERGKHRAALVYVYGLAYATGYSTDGYISRAALTIIQGRTVDAGQLVDVGLWHEAAGGWLINAYDNYQPSSAYADSKRAAGRRNVCARWMKQGKGCSCGQHS